MNKKRRITISAILGCIFIVMLIPTIQFGVDDSFITFRYARNLVDHGVWNWNLTGEKEEAYTNFTYAILSIIPEALGLNSLLFMKLIGIFLLIYLCIRLKSNLGWSAKLGVAYSFVIFNPLFYMHAFSGLETLAFVVLIYEFIILLCNEKINLNKFLLVAILLPMTRPEGALFSLIGFAYLTYYKKDLILNVKVYLTLGIGAIYFFGGIVILENIFRTHFMSSRLFLLSQLGL
jgi:hypothetical protein